MKHLFTLFLCLASVFSMNAQSVSLFNVDASGFPTVKAKFFAFDAANKQQRPSKSELTITENGQPRTITSVTCPPGISKSLSVCIMVDTYGYGLIKLAQQGTQRLINYLKPPKDEIAITMMNKGVQIHQDFTFDTAKASASVSNIPPAPGYVDVQQMFYYPYTGGVPFISGRTSDKKVLILVSDLHCPNLNLDTARLYQDAAKNNISVYAVLLGTSDYSGLFKRVAEKTGGKVYVSITSKDQIENIFQEIAHIEQDSPCEISWQSEVSCRFGVKHKVDLAWNSTQSSISYIPPDSTIAILRVSPSFVAFGKKGSLTITDTTIYLTAVNTDIIINDISLTNGSNDFKIVNTTYPIIIPKSTSTSITFRFTPTDSSISYSSFTIKTDVCDAYLSGTGGFPGKLMRGKTLHVTQPNGGEQFIAGSDTVITWEGISATDTVRIEYSVDNGLSWKLITTTASGLKYIWKNIPLPTSSKCKVRIQQVNKLEFDSTSSKLQYDLRGHRGQITNIVWSPDGKKIAASAADDIAIIWDGSTGDKLLKFEGHTSFISSIFWSPDGTKILTSSFDSTAIIWDAVTGGKTFTLAGHKAELNTAIWSPDGAKVITVSYDSTAVVWDATTGIKIKTLTIAPYSRSPITWCPDGTKFAIQNLDSTISIYDSSFDNKLLSIPLGKGISYFLQWSSDGSKIMASVGDTTIIWNAVTGFTIVKLGDAFTVAGGICNWSPDGSKLATFSKNNSATVWEIPSGIKLLTLKSLFSLKYISWSPDGSKISTAGGDGTTTIWNALDGTKIHTLKKYKVSNGFEISAVCWAPDGTKIVTGSTDNSLILWDIVTGSEILSFGGHITPIIATRWSPDGSKVVTIGSEKPGYSYYSDNNAIIWDAIDGKKMYSLSASDIEGSYPMGVSWSPDGSKVAVGNNIKGTSIWNVYNGNRLLMLRGFLFTSYSQCGNNWSPDGTKFATYTGDSCFIWDVNNGELIVAIRVYNSSISSVNWSPDGTKIATSNVDSVNIWDASNGTKLQSLLKHSDWIMDMRWSPDGMKMATSSKDKTAKIWDVTTGALLFTLNAHNSWVTTICWSPDGTKIVTSSYDNSAIIWDARNGILLRKLLGHTGDRIQTVNWSPDGTKICTGANDHTAKIWDVATGKNIYTLLGHRDVVGSVIWNPDGSRLITGSYDNTARIWQLESTPIQEDESDAVFSIIAPDPTFQNLSIDMGKVLVGQSKDSTVLGIICNKGSVPLHVLGIDITSGDATDFTIPRGAGDFFLDSNKRCQDVMFGFAPTKVGVWFAKATVRTTVGNFSNTISITGEGIAPTLAIVNPYIDFGKTPVGTPKDSTKVVTIKNVGTSDLTITQTDYNAVNTTNFSTLSGGNSFILKPNSSAIMDLRFLPFDVGRRSGILQFHYNGVGSPATVQLFGEGIINIPDTARTTIIAQDITAKAGEKVNLSLKLLKPTGMQAVGAPTNWYARIHYNKSILFNEQSSNVCAGTTDSCVLELTGVYNPKTDELLSIPCIATLGNTDNSSIVIDEFKWTNSGIVTDVATQNGTIKITGTCEDGGVRLFIPAKSSTSLATRPNPAQDKLQIQYGLREPLTVTLELLTMTGQVVQTIITNQTQAAGQYTLTNDLSVLGNGVYLLRLRTNKEMLTARVDLVK